MEYTLSGGSAEGRGRDPGGKVAVENLEGLALGPGLPWHPVHSVRTGGHGRWNMDVEKDEPRIYAFILKLLLINKKWPYIFDPLLLLLLLAII